MADYGYDCCSGPPHEESCRYHHNYPKWKEHQDSLAKLRVQGFVEHTNGVYKCRRGCGTLVWDVEAHIKNVCPTFEPVVG